MLAFHDDSACMVGWVPWWLLLCFSSQEVLSRGAAGLSSFRNRLYEESPGKGDAEDDEECEHRAGDEERLYVEQGRERGYDGDECDQQVEREARPARQDQNCEPAALGPDAAEQ